MLPEFTSSGERTPAVDPQHVYKHSLASFVFQSDLSAGAFSAIDAKHGELATMLVYCWYIEGEGSVRLAAD